jgi:hypothetical protein
MSRLRKCGTLPLRQLYTSSTCTEDPAFASTIFFQRKQSLYPVLQTALFNNRSINVPVIFINPEIALQVFSLDTFTVKFLTQSFGSFSYFPFFTPFAPKLYAPTK